MHGPGVVSTHGYKLSVSLAYTYHPRAPGFWRYCTHPTPRSFQERDGALLVPMVCADVCNADAVVTIITIRLLSPTPPESLVTDIYIENAQLAMAVCVQTNVVHST